MSQEQQHPEPLEQQQADVDQTETEQDMDQTETEQESNQVGQEGGWASGSMKVAKLKQRLDASGNAKTKVNRKTGEVTPSYNKSRSFRAFVEGVHLKGYGKITKTNKKTGEKITKEGDTNRYFHGDPSGAARKVVAQLQKGLTKKNGPLPGSRDVTGLENAVRIQLVEVTKGVRKANGQPFMYDYFGWRQPLDPNDENEKKRPKVITKKVMKKDKDTGVETMEEVEVPIKNRNIAIPAKGASSASAALEKSLAIGREIKRLKSLSADDRAAIASQKKEAKKQASEARKAAKKATSQAPLALKTTSA